MNRRNLLVGIVLTVALVLFGAGLFLIGNQHKAFRRHTDFYAQFNNVNGISKGAKIRVGGMDGGEVQDVSIPTRPSQKFRLKMSVDNRLHGLIRADSVVSVETEGLVGDKFLLIQHGTDQSPEAAAGATLPSKEPFEIGKLLDQATGLMNQVGGTLTEVQGNLDGALNAVTTTVNNTNGVVTDLRRGRGAAGVLLEDPKTAADTKQIVANARQTTENLNTAAAQVNGMLQDVEQRRLVAKVDDTLNSAKSATQQLDQTSQQLNGTMKSAFAEDQFGQGAGVNLQQSLSNINAATGNLADDTEALKHEFFFKGFFKRRGYYSLEQLPIDPYRNGELFRKPAQSRHWIAANSLFEESSTGNEILSAAGRDQIDTAVSQISGIYDSPLIVEGYRGQGDRGLQLVRSRDRAKLVRTYLRIRFHLALKDTGIIGLSATPPLAAGRLQWDGVCIVQLAKTK